MPTNTKVFWVDGDGKINFLNYNFPITAGTNGQSLVTDASGNITWQTISPNISLASEQVAFGNASNLISSTSNFKFYVSNIANPTNQRSAIFLVSTENDYTGQTYYGALRIKQQSSECLNVFDQVNAITNLSKGSIIRLGTYDSSLGSGIFMPNNQSIGELDFGVNDSLIGAKIKAFTEQIVNGGNIGTRLEFYVTPLNSITPALALKIDNTGKVYFKNYNFPLAAGTINQALVTDGSGNITFQTLFNTPTIANSVPYYDALTTKFLSTKLYWDNAASSFKWDNEINSFISNKLHMGFYNTATTGVQDSIYHGINFAAYNNSSYDAPTIRLGHMRGVIGSSQYLQQFDIIGKFDFNASDNIDGYAARIFGRATENHTLTSKGSSISFETTLNNSVTPQINLVISDDGEIFFKNYRFPVADGTANQFLKTDGAGQLSFANGGFATINQSFSPMPISVCDTAPTANTTQYYYQTTSEITGSINRMKIWGFSGTDTCFVGIYRGTLGGTKTLIGVGTAVCSVGANDIVLTAKAGQTLDLIAGENLIVGFYPNGISFRSIYDVGVADLNFGIENTGNLATELPATPTGTASAIRFACTLFKV